MAETSFLYQMYACLPGNMPRKIFLSDNSYQFVKVLKHDFFAATIQYAQSQNAEIKGGSEKIVLKLYRQNNFLGLPMVWFGKLMRDHEVSILKRLKHLKNIPVYLSFFGKTGFIYKYIEGNTIDRTRHLPDDFFDKLAELMGQIHKSCVFYLDMNKQTNIIAGNDGSPSLIDFQIAWFVPDKSAVGKQLKQRLRFNLERADLYHIYKLKRRFQPHLLRPDELAKSNKPKIIILHRKIIKPFKTFRRKFLSFLYSKKLMPENQDNFFNPDSKF